MSPIEALGLWRARFLQARAFFLPAATIAERVANSRAAADTTSAALAAAEGKPPPSWLVPLRPIVYVGVVLLQLLCVSTLWLRRALSRARDADARAATLDGQLQAERALLKPLVSALHGGAASSNVAASAPA